jgi:hypothetical protein
LGKECRGWAKESHWRMELQPDYDIDHPNLRTSTSTEILPIAATSGEFEPYSGVSMGPAFGQPSHPGETHYTDRQPQFPTPVSAFVTPALPILTRVMIILT